jgi:protein-glucosylgalactosylhydroxylysine glucosidase
LPFAFYTAVDIVAHDTTTLEMNLRHIAPDYLNDIEKRYENLEREQLFSIMHTKATTKTGKMDLVIASSFVGDKWAEYKIIHEDSDSNRHQLKTKFNVTKGETYRFGVISSLISTAHHEDPVNEAIRIVERALLIGESSLIAAHRDLWEKLWANDIVIEGHDEDQKNVRLMLYHCYAFINNYKSFGISPMGLSGLGYNGHVFWDMDLWIYPGILGLNPDIAKTLIEYRFERL